MANDPSQFHCYHFSMEELREQIRQDIARQSFSIRHVLSDGVYPPFTYTVGLHQPGTPFPELFISGLSMLTRVHFMLLLGFMMKGPPSRSIQRRIAREQGVGVDALSFPPGGVPFEPGRRYRGFAADGLPMCFGPVEKQLYDKLLGQAVVFHGQADFPVLQMIWSDTRGRFPWNAHYQRGTRFHQQILFDPQPFLPLKE